MSRQATDWAWRQDIKASMKLILLSLADRADEYHKAYPSASRLERDTGLNIKTIRSSLKAMQDLGIINDTGERKGETKQVVVWKLIGVDDDVRYEKTKIPKNGYLQKIPENGHLEDLKIPKNGLERYPKTDLKGTQNWVAEPVMEPVIELRDLVSSNDELLDTGQPKAEFELPTNRAGEIYPVSVQQVFELKELYPAVNVAQEFRNMIGWLRANPSRRKTKSGMPRFINSWLAKEQNRGGRVELRASTAQTNQNRSSELVNEIRLVESRISGLKRDIHQREKWNDPSNQIAITSFQAEIERLTILAQEKRNELSGIQVTK